MDQESKNKNLDKPKKFQINWTQIITISIAIAALFVSIKGCNDNLDNFKIENRAYVYLQSIYPSNIYEPFFEIKFKNYGKTPAKEIKVTEIKIDSIEIKKFDESLQFDSTEFAILISGNEQSIRLPANTPYYSIAEKHGKVFFIGKINYKDIFDDTHTTQFAGWSREHGDNTFMRLQGALNKSD
jgi:hypothetical protein